MSTKFRFLHKRHSSGAAFWTSPAVDCSVRPLWAVFALVECCMPPEAIAFFRFAAICSLLSPGFTYHSLSVWASVKICVILSITSGWSFATSFREAMSWEMSYNIIGLEGCSPYAHHWFMRTLCACGENVPFSQYRYSCVRCSFGLASNVGAKLMPSVLGGMTPARSATVAKTSYSVQRWSFSPALILSFQ